MQESLFQPGALANAEDRCCDAGGKYFSPLKTLISGQKIPVANYGSAGMLRCMDWQETTALLIVVATVAAFAWQRLRPRKFSFQRATHCGCSPSSDSPAQSVVFHARKGERPQVVVKMK
jgi:hypothetical protein